MGSDLARVGKGRGRVKLQYALALRMWHFEWAKIARLGQHPLVIGGTRSRVCVRSFASTPSHEIRTGGQDDGRWDALGNRRWHSLTHSPTYSTRLPYSTLYRFSFIHNVLSLLFLSFLLVLFVLDRLLFHSIFFSRSSLLLYSICFKLG